MTQPASYFVTPAVLDLFVRALVNEVDYDIHKNYECGEEDGLDHYPELVATAAEQLAAIVAGQTDPDFKTTLGGGHALIVEYGDCEFYGRCQCGKQFGMVTPDKFSDDVFGERWEHHVVTEVTV
ncbi:hypothetical protein AB0E25_33205 [Streptomyces bobili]|uniref:hypothetical protein n=1 Tax=Streptomyces bobili TaxID=67280 RepID=UPI0033FB0300